MAWPSSNFPTSLDSITDKVNNTDDVIAADVNGIYSCIEKIEAKIGVNNSAVTTSLDYLLKSTSSINPGHKHTLAALTDLLTGSSANYKFFVNYDNNATEWAKGIKGKFFTRALNAASATVAYTGFGFKPLCLIILATVDSRVSLGISDYNITGCVCWNTITSTDAIEASYSSNRIVYIENKSHTVEQSATWFPGGDGFSLQWTKAGSPPSETISFYALAFR